ncbi:MAG: hypothetical protein JEZ04_04970 [Spirochaetales bacterium]|nr:hypothetical protein [Spirochaetales bacterium]
MTREEFVFSIGFQGESAIIDGKAKKENGKLTTVQLVEKGLFRAAFCSALFAGSQDEMKIVVDSYNRQSGSSLDGIDGMKKLLGVYTVPDGIKKISVIK